MGENNGRLVEHMREIEEAAEEVLSDKQEIVDLDRKRCQNREAIRAMSHLNEEKKCWLSMGNCFFKLPKQKANELMQNGKYFECQKWPLGLTMLLAGVCWF